MTKLRRSGDTTSYIVVLLVCEFIWFHQNVFLSMASHVISTNLGDLHIQLFKTVSSPSFSFGRAVKENLGEVLCWRRNLDRRCCSYSSDPQRNTVIIYVVVMLQIILSFHVQNDFFSIDSKWTLTSFQPSCASVKIWASTQRSRRPIGLANRTHRKTCELNQAWNFANAAATAIDCSTIRIWPINTYHFYLCTFHSKIMT